MAVKSRRPFSYLNPHAPLFVPAAFLEAEDFSAEWWRLIHTCPAFREYWLRDCYDCNGPDDPLLLPDDVDDELDTVDDALFLDEEDRLADMHQAEENACFALEEENLFSVFDDRMNNANGLVNDLKSLGI